MQVLKFVTVSVCTKARICPHVKWTLSVRGRTFGQWHSALQPVTPVSVKPGSLSASLASTLSTEP